MLHSESERTKTRKERDSFLVMSCSLLKKTLIRVFSDGWQTFNLVWSGNDDLGLHFVKDALLSNDFSSASLRQSSVISVESGCLHSR